MFVYRVELKEKTHTKKTGDQTKRMKDHNLKMNRARNTGNYFLKFNFQVV